MKRIQYKSYLFILFALLLNALLFAAPGYALAAEAAPSTVNQAQIDKTEPKGILTDIQLSINGENGIISAQAYNYFTLGTSTIRVVLELYASDTYPQSYTNMQRQARGETADLNIFEELIISAPTGGKQQYWIARLQFKFDDRSWESRTTEPILYDGNGEIVV